jgi:hypothetical protein
MESPSFESLGHTLTRLLHSENRTGAHEAIQQHFATNKNNSTYGVHVNGFVEEVLEMWQAHCDVEDMQGQLAALSLEETPQGGDQNCGTIEEERDGEEDVLESGASITEGEAHEEEHTDAELYANVESDDTDSETVTTVQAEGTNYDSDQNVEDGDTDAELDANAEDKDTDAELDANAEDKDTDAELDANAEDEDTDAELDASAEDEDNESVPDENVDSEDTDSEPDTTVGDEDISTHLSLEQLAGPQHTNDGGRGVLRKASNTQLPRPDRFAASNPRRGRGPMRFVIASLLWIWSNRFFLGSLIILVAPRIWVRLFLLLIPLWQPFLSHSSRLVWLALKYWEPLVAVFWTCFDAWWAFTMGSSLDGPPMDLNLTKATLWTTLTVTCDSWTIFETVPCTSVETVLSTLTVSTVLTLPFVSILHSSGLTPTSTLPIATGMLNVVVTSNTNVLSSTPITSRVSTSSSQIPNSLQIESASSLSRDNTCPSLSLLPWMAYPASLSPFISIFPTPEPPTSAVPVHDTIMDFENEAGSGFVVVGYQAEPESRGSSPTASLPSHTLMASPSTTPHPPLPTGGMATFTALEAQTRHSSVAQYHSSELKPRHARGTPAASLNYWHLQFKLLAVVIVTLGLFLLPTIIRALTGLLARLPARMGNGDGNGGAQGPLSPPEALRNEIYAGADMVGRWVAAGFD